MGSRQPIRQVFRNRLQARASVQTASSCAGSVAYQQPVAYESTPLTYRPTPATVVPTESCPDGQCPLPQTPLKQLPKSTAVSLFGLSDYSSPSVETTIPKHILAQVDDDKPAEVSADFRRNLAKAVVEARKNGKINAREALRLRRASFSPAFVEAAHSLAVTQIAFSGVVDEANVPVDAEGVIQANGINWEGLAKFLEAFIPLLLTLLKAFGV